MAEKKQERQDHVVAKCVPEKKQERQDHVLAKCVAAKIQENHFHFFVLLTITISSL